MKLRKGRRQGYEGAKTQKGKEKSMKVWTSIGKARTLGEGGESVKSKGGCRGKRKHRGCRELSILW